MTSFVIDILALIGLFALVVVVLALLLGGESEAERARRAERARIEMEVRRAEQRLHEIARTGLQAMLEEARGYDRTGVK